MSFSGLLTRNFPWTPTEHQREALRMLTVFLEQRPSSDAFILRGYAGTGKTTIISALVRSLPSKKIRTVLLAPTGRAAKVMSLYSGHKASTIHKKIYRKKNAVTPDMTFELAPNLYENTLFIVDEASMISHERISYHQGSLLEDLLTYIQRGKSCQVLFVGDTAQLPPVGLSDSPALDSAVLQSNYHITCMEYELREVVRQAQESGILSNATWIRQQISQPEDEEVQIPRLYTKGFPDIYRMSGERLIEGLHYAYGKFGMENTLVICRSNKHANLYNQHIRHQILFREEELSGGDYVMVVRNNYHWLRQENPETDAFIANGDMAQVRRVRNVHEQYGFRFADVALEFSDMDEAETITCRVILNTLHADTPNLSQEDHALLYQRIMEDYAGQSDDPKEVQALIKADPYYNALQIKFAMAITCHKAQGGQWQAVFVDQGYLAEENVDREFLRWLYTAVTRATQELYLVNFNDAFFVTNSTQSMSK